MPEYWEKRKKISDMAQAIKEKIWAAQKSVGERQRNFQFRVGDVNADVIKADLAKGRYKELAYLIGLNTGKRIEEYRNFWRKYINSLPKKEKMVIISGVLNVLSSSTDIDIETLAKRTVIENKAELLKRRKDLWQGRITDFLAE